MATPLDWLRRYQDYPHCPPLLPQDAADPLWPVWEAYCHAEHPPRTYYEPHPLEWCFWMFKPKNIRVWQDVPRVLEELIALPCKILNVRRRTCASNTANWKQHQLLALALQALCLLPALGPESKLLKDFLTALQDHFLAADKEEPLYFIKTLDWTAIPAHHMELVWSCLRQAIINHYWVSKGYHEPSSYHELRRYARGEWKRGDNHLLDIKDRIQKVAQEVAEERDRATLERRTSARQKQISRLEKRLASAERNVQQWVDEWEPKAIVPDMPLDRLYIELDYVKEIEQGLKNLRQAHKAQALCERAKNLPFRVRKALDKQIQAAEEKATESRRQAAEQRRAEAEAEAAAAQPEPVARISEEELEKWRERINRRCRQIVTVFNGLYDKEIESDAILNGEVTGEYASIHSAPGTGLGLCLRQTLSQDLHQLHRGRTWLEVEEGDDQEECKATYRSSVLLVWHELAHLIPQDMVRAWLMHDNSLTKIDAAKAQAREMVMDAVGWHLGCIFYAHQDEGYAIPRTESQRRTIMLKAMAAMARRLIRAYAGKDLETPDRMLLIRFWAELAYHAKSRVVAKALDRMENTFADLLSSAPTTSKLFREWYAWLMENVDPTRIQFRDSLDSESFSGRKTRKKHGRQPSADATDSPS